jgi:hypothetical protein|tara:strand:- start:440 stop:664 length:225 start_codon:yes stop_codon:yes gene_type:complete
MVFHYIQVQWHSEFGHLIRGAIRHFLQFGDNTTRKKPNFSPAFKLESAQLVVDQNYFVRQATEAVNVSASSLDK